MLLSWVMTPSASWILISTRTDHLCIQPRDPDMVDPRYSIFKAFLQGTFPIRGISNSLSTWGSDIRVITRHVQRRRRHWQHPLRDLTATPSPPEVKWEHPQEKEHGGSQIVKWLWAVPPPFPENLEGGGLGKGKNLHPPWHSTRGRCSSGPALVMHLVPIHIKNHILSCLHFSTSNGTASNLWIEV